jgi:hypothetical protein
MYIMKEIKPEKSFCILFALNSKEQRAKARHNRG